MTNSTNEAGRDSDNQPRLLFVPGTKSSPATAAAADHGGWVVLVPIAVLLFAGLAVLTPRTVHEAPPELQVRSRTQTVPTASNPQIPEPIVRVNITPGGVDSLRLEIRGRFRVKPLETDEPAVERPGLAAVTVTAGKQGLRIGTETFAANRIELQPEQSPAIRVNGHLYRGRMRLFRRTDGKVSSVNVLPVEEYLASVVDSEMPAKFPAAAREAQAIVARTYALYQREHAESNAQYDLLSSQRSQKYLGFEYLDDSGRRLAGESESSRRAVLATRGIVCQRQGKLFCAYYSAVCGGQTTNGQQVFKDASDVVHTVPCEWCRESPYFRWTRQLPLDQFQNRVWEKDVIDLKHATVRQIVEPGDGQITQFEFQSGRKHKQLSGIELRERLPAGTLLSPHFKISVDADRVVFEGRGHGHGVGFCQWGAKGQAEAGRSSFEIVQHYFPGADLKTLNY